MAEYIENVVTQTSKMDWAFAFQRTGQFPLDRSALFSTYADAVAYAVGDGSDSRELGGTSYVGQPISVYDAEQNTVTLYLINTDRTLKEVGTVPVGDGLTIEVVDGVIKLKGAADAEEGAQPRKAADGSIEWVVPSTDTVDGLQTTVGALETDLETMQGEVEQLQGDVESLSANVYTKDETDSAIATAKQETIETILGESVSADFDTLKEVADWIQSDTTSSAELVTRVTNVETKLDTIEEDAQVNVIDSVDETQFGLDEAKHLTLLDIAMDKVTGLSDALAGKVDAVDGSRLMTTAEAEKLEKLVLSDDGSVEVSGTIAAGNVDGLADWITARAATLEGLSENNFDDALMAKLEGIEEGAQVNVIDGVSDEFVVSDEGKVLSVNAIAMDKITGLPEALAGKVDAVEGMGLSSNDFTDELLAKLEGIEAGAEVNYIKSASSEFNVSDAGELSVSAINVSKLVQDEDDTLILNGGSAE